MPAEPRDAREAVVRDAVAPDARPAPASGGTCAGSARRGLAAVVAAVLLASGGVVACSSGQDPDIPALEEAASATPGASQETTAESGAAAEDAATASAGSEDGTEDADGTQAPEQASAQASPPDPSEVTAQSLSDPATGYTMVSVPDGLDQAQAEVLLAFVAYDRATWEALRDMDGLEEVEATTTGSALESYTESYNGYAEADQHLDGTFSMTVESVELISDYRMAMVGACGDYREVTRLSSSGEDQTPDEFNQVYSVNYTLTYSIEGWKVSSRSESGVNWC
ncbi:hypothetical protein D5R93_11615 [Actinomyces lilanjuaniae]|uniref:Lipoprotein n=1 Tax=Actinomyces lilanjuaniae TaxID=2321394 RepID=A0ABM6Z5K7_9ACTO|nr:hypothetical protein [Actinomyces lilanjuaniae]AYD90484.1 hypothetical protein D5R93_11615 [Actinomyces lilanjuaniae]